MTKDQLYTMRMDIANHLESKGPECAACKSRRTEGIDLPRGFVKKIRSYSIDVRKCTCMLNRPVLYTEIATFYASMGMVYLPPYYMKKAAQASNIIEFPILGLFFLKQAENMMPQTEDMFEAESYFDPVVLKVSLKKIKAESFLVLGDTYRAASFVFQAMELLGMNAVCFHGVFNPSAFRTILPKFKLLHAEYITKLIGVLGKINLQAHVYKLAQNILRIEFVALSLYPIDFLQLLNHMTSMYHLKYLIHEPKKLLDLEQNIFRLCHEKLRHFDVLLELVQLHGIGTSYGVIIEVNLALGNLDRAHNTANEAIRILQLFNDRHKLPKIRIWLSHIHYHKKEYLDCCHVVNQLGEMPAATKHRIVRALYICSLTMFLRKTTEGVSKAELQILYEKCNAFASEWQRERARIIPKDLAFFVSISLALWCLYADKNTAWIAGKICFRGCYYTAVHLHNTMDKTKHNYWIITATVLLLKLQVKSLKKPIEDVSADESVIQEELKSLKHKIKTFYPIYREAYQKLVTFIEDRKKKEDRKSLSELFK